MNSVIHAIQDGNRFYDDDTGRLIYVASTIEVKDGDMSAAIKAREQFLDRMGMYGHAVQFRCSRCTSWVTVGQSCGCFDNGGQ